MNVYPRKPLEAEQIDDQSWELIEHGDNVTNKRWVSDHEFAALFYPAERLDTLLAECEELLGRHDTAFPELRAAFRAFREQVTA